MARRLSKGECAEPGCGKKVLKAGGREHRRCKEHLQGLARQAEARRDERKANGLCPKCGKRPNEPGLKSCLECSFDELDTAALKAGEADYVELMHPLDPSKRSKAKSIGKMSKAAGSV